MSNQPFSAHVTTLGQLDPTQPSRLLRLPTSKLSFAFFDPGTAISSQLPDLRKLSINEELYRPKRVVIETTANGDSFWRFVPKARKEVGCADEGNWPRIVMICGQLVECTLDMWDIYKLDPEYDCLVRKPPNVTVISRVQKSQDGQDDDKRESFSTSSSDEAPAHKRPRFEPSGAENTNSEHEKNDAKKTKQVEELIIDDVPKPPFEGAHPAAVSFKRRRRNVAREEIARERQRRKEKIAARFKSQGHDEDDRNYEHTPPNRNREKASGHSKSVPPETEKRKASSLSDSEAPHNAAKRQRHEPSQATHWQNNQLAREKTKREKKEKKKDWRRRAKEDEYLNQVYNEYEGAGGRANDLPSQGFGEQSGEAPSADGTRGATGQAFRSREHPETATSTKDTETNEASSRPEIFANDRETEEPEPELRRRAAIAESIAKLAELERDRPLWEEHARKRREREAAEEQTRRAEAEEKQQDALRREREQKEREDVETARKHAAEAARREREAAARRQREMRQREARWSFGVWTTMRALERYKCLCESFDVLKFSESDPLTFADVPWPVLHPPALLTVEDVDWRSVEQFFEAAKPHMRTQDYKAFVEKSHRRFHPDRWRSRGLLKNVTDEVERGCLEVAANTVAQALTPLWTDLKGR